jgi:ribosomal protein L37AE/L43A
MTYEVMLTETVRTIVVVEADTPEIAESKARSESGAQRGAIGPKEWRVLDQHTRSRLVCDVCGHAAGETSSSHRSWHCPKCGAQGVKA